MTDPEDTVVPEEARADPPPSEDVIPDPPPMPEVIPVPETDLPSEETVPEAEATDPSPEETVSEDPSEEIDLSAKEDEASPDEIPIKSAADSETRTGIPENAVLLYIPEDQVRQIIDDLNDQPELAEKAANDLQTPGSRIRTLAALYHNPDAEAEDSHRRLILAKENGEIVSRVLKVDGTTVLAPGRRDHRQSGPLEGQAAVQAFKSVRNKQFGRRIPLYNSGICIELEPPTNSQLNQYTSQIFPELDSRGRMMGALFYLYMDFYVKEQAGRLIRELTIDASVKNWQRGDNLLRAIALEDYDVILMAIAALMYPDGYDRFEHPCINPTGKCDHVIRDTVSLDRMIYTNFARMPEEAREFMRQPVGRLGFEPTLAELDAYRELIPFETNGSAPNEVVWEDFVFVMRSPTWFEYREAGNRYLDMIRDMVETDDAEAERSRSMQAIAYRMLRQLSPWIKEIRSLDETGAVSFSTTDMAAIENILDHVQTIDVEDAVYPLLARAINRHKLSHACYPAPTCPACGHEPETESGYLTLNPMQTFFIMCVDRSRLLT